MSIEAANALMGRFRMPGEKMPSADAVFEVSATPFEAVAVSALFLESVARLCFAHKMLVEGKCPPELDPVEAALFFDKYGDAEAHAAGAAACRRLASNAPTLTFGELCCIAVICRLGVSLMREADDWADFVGRWLEKVRKQVLDDHEVRSES